MRRTPDIIHRISARIDISGGNPLTTRNRRKTAE
jgi:hypothetical protein